jgi:nucleoside-diphosphate-sugar epimerase
LDAVSREFILTHGNEMTTLTVAVTGASGFVGTTICRALTDTGHRVIALGRTPIAGYENRSYDLSEPVADETLSDADAVVHCAYDLSLTDSRAIATRNVEGAALLVRAADRSGTRPILISSMSAYPGTTQIYGQAKLASESEFLLAGGEAVRVGLVWGGAEGGMIGTLKRLSGLPIVPRLGRGTHQFMVHVDDMASGLVKLLEQPRVGEPLGLAHPTAVPFEEIIRGLGGGRQPRFVTIPWQAAYGAMRAAERAGVQLPARADSLLGLVRPAQRVPNADAWAPMGLVLRPFVA